MQARIPGVGDLLDKRGRLAVSGWAKEPLLVYDRSRVAASPLRVKEWDYYEITNPEYGIVLLVYDIGYQGRAVVKWMDFRRGTFEEHGPTVWLTRGSMGLPAGSDTGDVVFERGGDRWVCRRGENGIRVFEFEFPGFRGGAGLSGTLELRAPVGLDSMVNAIPFGDPTRFVYARKINCLVPDGRVRVGGDEYGFTGENHSWGCLDWSRAVFPYHVRWRWATASGSAGGVPFGINVDYGFGTASSKSMVFYDGAGHHLDEARYTYDAADVMKDWTFTDNEGRMDLTFHPVCVERGGTSFVVLRMSLLKVYGFFTGRVRLDDGRWVDVRETDRLFGSAEVVENHW